MPSSFFEIDPNCINTDHKGGDKYTPEEYSQMTDSLKDVQGLMDTGLSGKDILSQHSDHSPTGIAETYKQFYDSKHGSRVKVDINSDGNLSCNNGKHRCESAKEKNMYVPAEVNCSDEQQLADIEKQYGSGRDLSQFNPRAEQNELDREQTPPSWNEFKSRYTDDTSVDSSPETSDIKSLRGNDGQNPPTNSHHEKEDMDDRVTTSAPPDPDGKISQLKGDYGQPSDNTRSSNGDREDLRIRHDSGLKY
jgi:hypothetical protein